LHLHNFLVHPIKLSKWPFCSLKKWLPDYRKFLKQLFSEFLDQHLWNDFFKTKFPKFDFWNIWNMFRNKIFKNNFSELIEFFFGINFQDHPYMKHVPESVSKHFKYVPEKTICNEFFLFFSTFFSLVLPVQCSPSLHLPLQW